MADRFDPDAIVQPSGLTRQQIINKVQKGNMHGLTEADVKAVQDEMWLREKAGSAPTNKDGTVRRKPGPAKGWKKLRGKDWDESKSEGGTSIGDGTMNGADADAEISALLGEDEDGESTAPAKKPRPRPSGAAGRKRKMEELAEETRLHHSQEGGSEFDSDDENRLLGDTPGGSGAASGSRGGRIKEPGVGKGRWTRPIRPADFKPGDEPDADQSQLFDMSNDPQTITIPPNSYDPRGVSEVEARVRLNLVEDLEKAIWASICRDVPRVSIKPVSGLSI